MRSQALTESSYAVRVSLVSPRFFSYVRLCRRPVSVSSVPMGYSAAARAVRPQRMQGI